MSQNVGELVRELEQNYISSETRKSEYVTTSLKQDLDRIDAYLESKHISGETDSQDREKPFFNIVTAAVNIWFRATDIDRKNIRLKATKASHYVLAFLATIHLQEWMRKSKFGQFLNKWGMVEASHLSAVLKFVEKGGELHPQVISWDKLIVDEVDFENNPVIEKLFFTPAQLRKKKEYNQEFVKQLLDALGTRETMDGQAKDTKSNYVEVYEVHGELPLSCLTDNEEDEETYVQQMHVLSFVASRERGDFDDYTLYSGREAKNPYMLTSLLPNVDGSISLKGAVKTLFDAQWMVNHTAKTIKDQLDLASKLIFQTSDGNFVGRNVLSSIQNGDIMIHAVNQPLTSVANTSHDISALQAYGQQWQAQGNQAVGISEAMLGAAPKSGTAWRQTEALLQENHSLFELMTENKGLDIENMFTNFVIPYIKKKMDTTEEIAATLESYQIKQIDSRYVPNEAVKRFNQIVKEHILSGKTPQANLEEIKATVQEEQNAFGNQRFIKPSDIPTKTWKEILKDFAWNMEVDVTGEQKDTQAVMTTLSTVMQTLATNPMVLNDPNMKLLFNRILEATGAVSPLELSTLPQQPQPVQNIPQQVPQPMVK